MASTMPCSAGLEGARRGARIAGAALWVHPSRSAPVRRWRAAIHTTGTFLVLLVYGPRSIGVIGAQSGCFERRRWLLRAKFSSLPTSSSCDKDGLHNLHNCTLACALGIVTDIIVALATLRGTAWGLVRDLEQQPEIPLLHGRCQTVILRGGRSMSRFKRPPQTKPQPSSFSCAFARLGRGVPAAKHSTTFDRRPSKSHKYTATASSTVK